MTQTITALKAQKRNNQRINVHIDGKFAFGMSRIVAAWLEVGQKITPEKITELQNNDSAEVAYQRALNFLSYRPRSQAEVIKNLRKHATSEEHIELVMERLLASNMVNDESFAALWVENRSEFRPRGAYALRMELRQKGITDEVIESVLDGLEEDKLAYMAATKGVRKYKNLKWLDFRKELGGYLSRRGFSYQIISDTVSKIWIEFGNNIEANEVFK